MRLSVIVPALDEAACIQTTLAALSDLRAAGHEVIVVDGGSYDATVSLAEPLADAVLHAPRGRAVQMNMGAEAAKADVLLFLHADTLLPADVARLVRKAVRGGRYWGRFDVSFSRAGPLLQVVAWAMNWRSRLTGICTGDQAMFVTCKLFAQAGGFPKIALMEDIALSKRLRRFGRPACLRQAVITSARRWQQAGVIRTILLMWSLRLRYFLGAAPERLARVYERSRE
jgi:rSAM/selenodomain-associated transferase 2